MRRSLRGCAWLMVLALGGGCRTTAPAFQDWRDEAGFRVEATSRTIPASIETVCLAVNRAAVAAKLASHTLEIAAKLPDSDETPVQTSDPTSDKAKRVAIYDNKSVLKSPLGAVVVELDKEDIKVDLDALTIHHARLVGATSEGRSVEVRIDPSAESEGVVVAARVGTGQRLDGAASQAFLEHVVEAMRVAPAASSPAERAKLFEKSAVFFDKQHDGQLTKASVKVSLPKPSVFGRKVEPDPK
jgi:hypothetical protein